MGSIEKKHTQLGLFDHLKLEARAAEKQTILDKLNDLVPWEMFRGTLNKGLKQAKPAAGPGGRPPFDRVVMFKILILQSIYQLSDAETEYQILDRYSFRRFLGLTASDKVPDEKTIWAFRERLGEESLHLLTAEFLTFLSKHGVQIEHGRILDATFCPVRIQRNAPSENKAIKQGKLPKTWKDKPPSSLRQKDVEARWGRKYGVYTFGYKHHICIDSKTKLIMGHDITAANAHDQCFNQSIIDQETAELYADRAYDCEKIRTTLRAGKIEACIPKQRRGSEGPLGARHLRQAKKWNKVRARVEHVFGSMKMSLGGYFFRGVGMTRAAKYLAMKTFGYNLIRGHFLIKAAN